jgi:hypothetical protein
VPFTAIPLLQLPFQLSIITHHAELASKNTGVSSTAHGPFPRVPSDDAAVLHVLVSLAMTKLASQQHAVCIQRHLCIQRRAGVTEQLEAAAYVLNHHCCLAECLYVVANAGDGGHLVP